MQELNIPCWRHKSQNIIDELKTTFLGSSTHPNDESMIFNDAWQSRHKYRTTSMGQVCI